MSYAGAARMPGSRAALVGLAVPAIVPVPMATKHFLARPRQMFALSLPGKLVRQRWQRSCLLDRGQKPTDVRPRLKHLCVTDVDIQQLPDQSRAHVPVGSLPGVARLPQASHEEYVRVSYTVILSMRSEER